MRTASYSGAGRWLALDARFGGSSAASRPPSPRRALGERADHCPRRSHHRRPLHPRRTLVGPRQLRTHRLATGLHPAPCGSVRLGNQLHVSLADRPYVRRSAQPRARPRSCAASRSGRPGPDARRLLALPREARRRGCSGRLRPARARSCRAWRAVPPRARSRAAPAASVIAPSGQLEPEPVGGHPAVRRQLDPYGRRPSIDEQPAQLVRQALAEKLALIGSIDSSTNSMIGSIVSYRSDRAPHAAGYATGAGSRRARQTAIASGLQSLNT